jgi:hypothetical protein
MKMPSEIRKTDRQERKKDRQTRKTDKKERQKALNRAQGLA